MVSLSLLLKERAKELTGMKNKQVIILLGPPGAGKGTQLKLIQDKFGYKAIGSGNMLRNRKRKKDFTGNKIGLYIDNGSRIPSPVIFNLWMNKMETLKQDKALKGFVMDGSPRTSYEAEMLEMALDWYEWKNKKVLFIKISEKESIHRLTKRRMCRECGRLIPWLEGFKDLKKCDKCGGELISRPDDTEKGIRERLKWYKTDVLPAVNYYKKKGELIVINGEQSIENVSKDILKALR